MAKKILLNEAHKADKRKIMTKFLMSSALGVRAFLHTPVFDKGLEVQGEAHAQRQQGRVLLQHFGQDLEIRLTVLVGKLSGGQLHLVGTRKPTP